MAKEPANNSVKFDALIGTELEWGQEIHDDVVVISSVESDVIAPCFNDGSNHVQRLVPIKGGDLDGGNILNLSELPPERVRQRPAASSRLQVKADHGKNSGNGAAVSEQLVIGGRRKCTQAYQTCVKAELAQADRFVDGLLRWTANPPDPNRVVTLRKFLHGQLEDGAEKTVDGITNGKLRRVNANGETAGSGCKIVTKERALAAFIETALSIQRQRRSWNHHPLLQDLANLWFE
jgi:hypothetical protein